MPFHQHKEHRQIIMFAGWFQLFSTPTHEPQNHPTYGTGEWKIENENTQSYKYKIIMQTNILKFSWQPKEHA